VNVKDTGNQCYKLSKAINETFTGVHESRAFTRKQGYTKFPYDVQRRLVWAKEGFPDWIVKYWATCDIVHKHGKPGWEMGWPKANPHAGVLFHQHGRFGPGIKPEVIWAHDRERKQLRVVSTINLLSWVNNRIDRWFPPPMDIEWIDSLKTEAKKTYSTIRIVHTPTHRGRKHTELFLNVCKELRKKYRQVEPVIVESKTHEECMKIRATADIVYDQLLLQYGTSGLEGMALGVPVVAGCADSTWAKMVQTFATPPFVRANPKTLFKVLSDLIESWEMREDYGEIGRKYIEEYHSFRNTAELAIKTYLEAIEYGRSLGKRK
jgi:hypothetical protein